MEICWVVAKVLSCEVAKHQHHTSIELKQRVGWSPSRFPYNFWLEILLEDLDLAFLLCLKVSADDKDSHCLCVIHVVNVNKNHHDAGSDFDCNNISKTDVYDEII